MSSWFKAVDYKPTENDVERGCIAVLDRRNYKTFRLHAGRFHSWDYKRVLTGVPKGTPDYAVEHAYYPGFLLEVKRPGGATSPDQDCRIWELRNQFRLAVCVAFSAIELEAWLEQHEINARRRWASLLRNPENSPSSPR